MTKLFSSYVPDPIGAALGMTGFYQFETNIGVSGLAKASGNRLYVLAVISAAPGTGQFREFVRQAKSAYHKIVFLEILTAEMEAILRRYGFRPGKKRDSMAWKRHAKGRRIV